jgi:Outer membrane protein
MKKALFLSLFMIMGIIGVQAQKFALIDMEYILKNIPAYEMANEQINSISKKWQAEVETLEQEGRNLYKTYQADLVFLSAEMKTKRENEVIAKEMEAQELKRKYFGTDGELFKKRESLVKPIQDEIYNAAKEISESAGYAVVVDRAFATTIIYASPKIDISDQILAKLGYSK